MGFKRILEQANTCDWKHRNWYRDANTYLATMTEHFTMPLEKVVGICSALSPSCGWKQNVQDTYRFIRSNGKYKGCVTYGPQVVKAHRILRLKKRFNEIPDILHGPKTVAFYNALMSPSSNGDPVIDTHMVKAYLNDPKIDSGDKIIKALLKPNKVVEMQGEIRELAAECNINIHSCQAIIWSTWKRITGNRIDSNALPIWESLLNAPYIQEGLFVN